MTNHEAIEELQLTIDLIKQNGKDWLDERDIPILSMAIEAMKELNALREQNSSSQMPGTSDMVSRQVAIDAVDSETISTNPEHFRSSEKFNKFMDDADIASFGKWKWANGFNTALVATTIRLEKLPSAQPEQRWIPCSERLPKYGKRVLVCFKAGRKCPHDQIQVGCFGTHEVEDEWFEKIGNVTVLYTDKYYYPFDNVTAWMPLPEPYGGNTND